MISLRDHSPGEGEAQSCISLKGAISDSNCEYSVCIVFSKVVLSNVFSESFHVSYCCSSQAVNPDKVDLKPLRPARDCSKSQYTPWRGNRVLIIQPGNETKWTSGRF